MERGELKREPITEFGAWLWERMQEECMSTRVVADMVYLSRTTVYHHIHGMVIPSDEVVLNYCDLFQEPNPHSVVKMAKRDRESKRKGLIK